MKISRNRLMGMVLTIGVGLVLTGCEPWKNLRRKDSDDASATTDFDSGIPKNSHPSGGSAGMWSSQARSIEGNLGVGK